MNKKKKRKLIILIIGMIILISVLIFLVFSVKISGNFLREAFAKNIKDGDSLSKNKIQIRKSPYRNR
jgi:Na+-transporting methylmalonyl-CoA/oxaloacetate decarboxylase gamma subunit